MLRIGISRIFTQKHTMNKKHPLEAALETLIAGPTPFPAAAAVA